MNSIEDNNITNTQSNEKKNKSISDLSILGRKIMTMVRLNIKFILEV